MIKHFCIFVWTVGIAICSQAIAEDSVIDFEDTEIGKPIPSWIDQGVTFELASQPKKSKAIGRISFFPHIGTGHKGIVNAMANEAIPVRATFEKPIRRATLRLWASTTSSALIQAFNSEGKLVAEKKLERVPVRQTPVEHVPFFEIEVESEGIHSIEVSGSKPGGFIAIDELRWTTEETK